MSRRWLSLLLVLGLLMGALTGCGDKTTSGQTSTNFGVETATLSPSPEILPDSTVDSAPTTGSFAMPINESYGWDPYACLSMENRAVMQLIYEGLFVLNNEFDPEPWLCKSYTVSEDGLVYTLELQDAAFSNGKALNADDVVYSMEQASLSELYGDRFYDISSYYASGLTTVTIELSEPNDRLPCLLNFPIIPAAVSTVSPVGTGPFVRNGNSVLTVNTQWWQGADTLNFQTVTLYSSASAEDTRDGFEIDNVHFVYNDPSSSTAATFHCDYELWNSRGTVMQYIGFNFSNGIFQDQEVRAAITHAIDRSGIAESVYHNFADAAALPVAPSSSMYDEDLALEFSYTSVKEVIAELMETSSFYLPEDYVPSSGPLSDSLVSAEPSQAPEEEAEASEDPSADEDENADTETAEDGEEDADGEEETDGDKTDSDDTTAYNAITMLVMEGNLNREAAARQVAQNLTDVGFTVTLNSYEEEEFVYRLNTGEWDIYYGEVVLQPDFDLRPLLSSGGSLNYGGFSGSSELSSLMAKAQENSGNRYDLYEYIMEQGYLCPVLFINNAVFTTRGVFTGLNPSPDFLFYQISNIHVNN